MLSDKAWRNAHLFNKYRDVEWDEKRGDPHLWEVVSTYIENLKTMRDSGQGLLLQGDPGTGKTLCATLVGVAAVEAGYKVKCMTMAQYIAWLMRKQDLDRKSDAYRDDEIYIEWKRVDAFVWGLRNKVDFLILDDVGKEYSSGSGWTEMQFDYIFRERWNYCFPTIITTNIPVDQWEGKYSASMADFIHRACVVVEVAGRRRAGR